MAGSYIFRGTLVDLLRCPMCLLSRTGSSSVTHRGTIVSSLKKRFVDHCGNGCSEKSGVSEWSVVLLTLFVVLFFAAFGSAAQQMQAPDSALQSSLTWESALGHRFLSSKGRDGFLFTIGAEGVEGYLYPFRVFHDLRVSFRMEGSDALIEGRSVAQSVSITPSTVTRLYAAGGLRVREILFVPVDQPVLVILYEVESKLPVDIKVAFRPDFDLMWPAGIGGQSYSWDEADHAFLMEEPSGTYHGRIGSPEIVSHSDPVDRSEPWNTDRTLSFEIRATPHKLIPIIATIGLPKSYDALDLYTKALKEYSSWLQQADAHYRAVRSERLQIETGDAEADQALAWATIALDQAEACNPGLGCGLVAGYGPTWDTRRPQYAWFFTGDALVTMWALEAGGAHDEVVRALSFIRKYQNSETGAMWHEISQSASYVDWFHRYPYIYRHTDSSPLYLLAMRNIWRSSGDRSLLEVSWLSLEAAWRFCLSHVDANDGLMVIPQDQSGVNENEADRTEKELPLEMIWAAGADAFAELAAATGKQSLSEEARQASQRARASLAEFWDPARHYYFEGLRAGNRPFSQQMASPAWGVWQGLLPARERDMVLDRLAQPAFQTSWGVRSIPADDPNYQPDSYAHGSVWPLTTGTYILAALAAHRPEQAWPLWHALVQESFVGAPGHLPEVLSGDSYRPLDVSVPEQTWSSAALLTSTVRGILGLDPDMPHNKLRFEPHLPVQWTHLNVRGLRLGGRKLEFTLQRVASDIELSIINDGEPFQLEFAPQVSSKAVMKAYLDGKNFPVSVRREEHDVHADMTLTVGKSLHLRLVAQHHTE